MEGIGGADEGPFGGGKQRRLGVEVGAVLARGAVEQVKRVGKQRNGQQQTSQSRPEIHLLENRLRGRGPGLVILHVAVVGVVGAVGDAPSVVGHHDGGVDDVAHKVVQCLVGGEGLMATVVAHHKQGPKHGALGKPVEGPDQGVVEGVGGKGEAGDDGEVLCEVGEGTEGVALEALLGDGVAEVLEGEGGGVGKTTTSLWV